MSRDIKFRTWDTRWSRWHTEPKELLWSQHGYREPYPADGTLGMYRVDAHIDGPPAGLDQYDRERFILEQFTGMKDGVGADVYEGDIVRLNTSHQDDEFDSWAHAVIRFSEGAFKIDHPIRMPMTNPNYRVVGNIHEHSHLFS